MKTKVLPMVWYGTAFSTFAGVLIFAQKALGVNLFIAVVVAWLTSIVLALFIGSIVVSMRPDLRFSTKLQEDGLGYVHEPMSVVVYMTVIAFLCAVVMKVV